MENFSAYTTAQGDHILPTPQGFDTPNASLSLDSLSSTAATLNYASRRLNDAIDTLDEALQKLNLGVDAWISTWTKDGDPNQVCEYEEIGYSKVKGFWGISIRLTLENHDGPEPEVREWHFREAPRDMRIRGAKFLHKLIEKMNDDATLKAREIEQNANDAEDLAGAITLAAEASKNRVKAAMKGGK